MMSSVQWRINVACPGEWHVVGLRVEDTASPQAVWPSFFNGLPMARYPDVIEAAVLEVGSGSNAVGVIFPGDLDEFDLTQRAPLPADSVEIYCYSFPEEVMPRATFNQVLLAVGEQLLEHSGQPGEWYAGLRGALYKLRTKIRQDLQG
jgi:hypothetical protein